MGRTPLAVVVLVARTIACTIAWTVTGGTGAAAADDASRTHAFTLPHGAFTHDGVANVVAHEPLDGPNHEANHEVTAELARPIDLVVFLHGFRGCAAAQVADHPVGCGPRHSRVPGRGLGEVHDRSGTRTLFVVPQLALLARDGSAGRFTRPGVFRAFLGELLDGALADRVGDDGLARVRRVALVAHSAGYQAALAILQHGGVSDLVTDVVLLDALYAGTEGFARWVAGAPGRRLISLHGGSGKPARNTRALVRRLSRAGLPTADLDPAALAHAPPPSARAPADGRASPASQGAVPADAATHDPDAARVLTATVSTPHARYPQVHLPALLRFIFGASGNADR